MTLPAEGLEIGEVVGRTTVDELDPVVDIIGSRPASDAPAPIAPESLPAGPPPFAGSPGVWLELCRNLPWKELARCDENRDLARQGADLQLRLSPATSHRTLRSRAARGT